MLQDYYTLCFGDCLPCATPKISKINTLTTLYYGSEVENLQPKQQEVQNHEEMIRRTIDQGVEAIAIGISALWKKAWKMINRQVRS